MKLVLDSKLIFNKHSNHIFSRVNKSIGLLRTFQPVLPRSSFFTIYKAFIRNHFDYADVIHDQSYKSSFHKKLESIRNNATLAPTGAVRGSSSEKLYQELGLKSPQNRWWFRKLCQFYKILKSKSPRYLFDIIPTKLRVHNNRYCDNIPLLKIKHNYFRNSFFPSSIVEWNKLSREVRNSENIRIFKKRLLEFIRPSPNSIFDIYNPYGIKLLTRLRLGLSHLNEHKFKHGFNDTINPICICGGDIESINHFFLHCPEYSEARQTLFDNIQSIDKMLLSQNESSLTHLLLYGDPKRNSNVNAFILNLATEFILSSGRFNKLLFNRA